ncbi:DEAD/DEAH box helicase [Pseudomonas sp. EMN2]|uniref:DEAD/DEAH box helicase n=1 Tax=Pseudomonas sp. EMN2 TaxID=2615212 RepID=UPI00129BAFFE|nr:DEAD/DEAH box helicase [Pseudomonas sp. EMN2]
MSMTYGAIKRTSTDWAISCEPQVRARLKRVFPRMPQSAGETQHLKATAENSRELLWFMERYPMEVSRADRDELEALAEQHVQLEVSMAELVAGRMELPPFDLSRPPREYQRYAAAQLGIRSGMLLADDVGLGKTVTAMCPMTIPGNLPAVVVYPASLPNHWPEKLAEFLPNLRVHRVRTGAPYPLIKKPRQRIKDLWDTLPDVILISYHKLRGWADVLGEIVKYLVFEECQQLRNPGTEIYKACVHMAERASPRMGLSATPIFNYGGEFFHVVNVLSPGALGSYHEFLREWCISAGSNEKPKLREPEVFGAYLRREGIMLRRTRRDVGRELPALSKIVHEIEHDAKVLDAVKGDAIALAKTILASHEGFRGQRMQAAGQLDVLLRHATGISKAPYVAEFVKLLVESGEQVLLFGWHRDVYQIWAEKLAEFNPSWYTGTESPTQKQAAKLAFETGESRVMIISLRASAGIDGLQHHCSTVVYGELDWSPAVHEQGTGRVHRDDQLHPVQAFYLMSNEGTDPLMAEVLGIKKEQIEGVRNPQDNLIERLDTGGNSLRLLAEKFLIENNIPIPKRQATPIPISASVQPEQPELAW